MCVLSHFGRVRLCATLWIVVHQTPVCLILQARILEWVAMPSSRGSSPTLGANLVKQSLYQLSHQGILSSRCLRQFVRGEPVNQLSDGNQAWH